MHHGDWGRGSGFHWFGIIGLILWLVAVGGLVWFAVTLLRRTRHLDTLQAPAMPPTPPAPPAPPAAARPSARNILDERLARGEIDVDDYHQRIAALAGPVASDTPAGD